MARASRNYRIREKAPLPRLATQDSHVTAQDLDKRFQTRKDRMSDEINS